MRNSRVPADVLESIHAFVKRHGADWLSVKTGTPAGTIYNKANPNDSTPHKPTVQDLLIWTQLAGDYSMVQALCRALDGVFVPLHTQQLSSDLELLDLVLTRDMKQGEFADALSVALGDGRVSGNEFADLRNRGMNVVVAIMELLSRLEGMVDA